MADTNFNNSILNPEEARTAERQAEIQKCLEDLRSTNPYHRSLAAKRLGELRAEPEALAKALEDPNSFVRSAAAEALGHVGGDPTGEVSEALMAAIDDPNDYVCAAAVNSLGLLHTNSAAEQLQECLVDTNPYIVQAAILALARISPPEVAEKLAAFLDAEHYLIHLSAVRAVGLLGYEPAGPKILDYLDKYLQDGDRQDLKLAKLYIDVLARLQVREAIPLLIEIARRQVGLRSAAVEALIDLKADEAAPVLAPLLNDPSNKLRRSLVEMMTRAGYRAALPVVRPLLRDANIGIREAALAAVSRWEDLVSVDTVRWMCYHDPNPFVRPQAIATLVSLVGEQALPDLVTLSVDMNSHVRRAVALALGSLPHLPENGVQVLNRLAQDPEIGESAQVALAQHDLEPAEPKALPDTPPPLLLPEELLPELPHLLSTLETWQQALAGQAGDLSFEAVSQVDQAISTLVVVLRDIRRKQGE